MIPIGDPVDTLTLMMDSSIMHDFLVHKRLRILFMKLNAWNTGRWFNNLMCNFFTETFNNNTSKLSPIQLLEFNLKR